MSSPGLGVSVCILISFIGIIGNHGFPPAMGKFFGVRGDIRLVFFLFFYVSSLQAHLVSVSSFLPALFHVINRIICYFFSLVHVYQIINHFSTFYLFISGYHTI